MTIDWNAVIVLAAIPASLFILAGMARWIRARRKQRGKAVIGTDDQFINWLDEMQS